ncbi:MAG: 16S rRNA (guanine(966)-N(2))-methyltransferase RsmD [Oligoflexia bacterium]|nr:16S rRNA (guanine(966)-N(2))-methyltransferase RsmD [Oligoflexia bacterium]
MRVVAGSARGRKLQAVPGSGTRSILDRVKTALFDILRPDLPELRMLDLFAGSGAVGIEALSQGAPHCTFIDLGNEAFKTIKANLELTGLSEHASVMHTDAFSFLRRTQENFDLIYVAPPQYKNIWVEALHTISERPHLLSQNGLVIAQIDPSEYDELALGALQEFRQEKYGNTLLVFYRRVVKSSKTT